MNKKVFLIGYSEHGRVAADILLRSGRDLIAYCENEEKKDNIYELEYWGVETNPDAQEKLSAHDYFIAVGNNVTRGKIYSHTSESFGLPINAIHPQAIVASNVELGAGVMIAANAAINPLAKIGNVVICNTGSIIEHDCILGDFCHIAPGATLCGTVEVGPYSFIGANAVVLQGVKIGSNVTIGAGSVVLEDVPDNQKLAGNPARSIF